MVDAQAAAGVVSLPEESRAKKAMPIIEVTLPEYFEALNDTFEPIRIHDPEDNNDNCDRTRATSR